MRGEEPVENRSGMGGGRGQKRKEGFGNKVRGRGWGR